MYTTQQIKDILIPALPDDWELWEILDPDGDQICTIIGKDNAEALLSHLNK